MLDSDTLPVDHAGNSELARPRKFPWWLGGLMVPPLAGVGVAYLQGIETWKGLCGGSAVALAWLGWLAWRDVQRQRALSTVQDRIEEAWTCHAKGEGNKAEELLTQAVSLAVRKMGRFDLVTLACLHTLGNLYRLRNDPKGAASCYDQALPIYQRILPEAHPARAAFHGHRAANYQALQRPEEALTEARRSAELWSKQPGQALAWSEALTALGTLAEAQNLDDEALHAYSEALRILRETLPVQDLRVVSAMGRLGGLYIKLRRWQESEAFLEYVVGQYRVQTDVAPERFVEALLDLVQLRLAQERPADSEALLVEALVLLQRRIGPKEKPLAKILDAYKQLVAQHSGEAQTHYGLANLVLIFCGERERLRSTLEKFPHYVDTRDATGWGPLHWASFIGRDDIIHYLLQRGAHLSLEGDQVSPLHVAAAWGKRECLLALLDADADPNTLDSSGWTPLFWCAYGGQTKLLELLLKRGADPNQADPEGRSPLHVAAAQGNLAAVAALVSSGARLTAKDRQGLTPLHGAAQHGHLAVCECLVFNGASLEVRSVAGKSPLQQAADSRHRLLHRVLKRLSRQGLGKNRAPVMLG